MHFILHLVFTGIDIPFLQHTDTGCIYSDSNDATASAHELDSHLASNVAGTTKAKEWPILTSSPTHGEKGLSVFLLIEKSRSSMIISCLPSLIEKEARLERAVRSSAAGKSCLGYSEAIMVSVPTQMLSLY